MSIEEFIKELESNLEAAEPGSLTPTTRFREMPWWDSLAALTTLAVFDGCFGRQLTGAQLATCATITELYQHAQPS